MADRGAASQGATSAEALLERGPALALIATAVAEAAAGAGRAVLIEGEPGIGKTALPEAAGRAAGEAGLEVISARGRELERELGFGVVRQPPAAPAAETVLPTVHGLYWMTLKRVRAVQELRHDQRLPVLSRQRGAEWVHVLQQALELLLRSQRRRRGLRRLSAQRGRSSERQSRSSGIGSRASPS